MKSYIRTAIKISVVLYVAILFLLLFVRQRGSWWMDVSIFEYAKMHMNLIPFKTIMEYVNALTEGTMNTNIPLENLLGNLFLFFPLGIYLPYFSKRINSLKRLIAGVLPIFLIIEVFQFLTKRGAFDIDDLILNMTGAILGYLLWKSKPVQAILKKINQA